MMTKRLTYNAVCDRLYFSMKARFNGFSTSEAARPLPFTLEEFKEWLLGEAYSVQPSMLQEAVNPKVLWGCPYCGLDIFFIDLSIDHMTPISRGGSYALRNLSPCHATCNRAKGPLSRDEFLDLIEYLRVQSDLVHRDIMTRLNFGTTHRMEKARAAARANANTARPPVPHNAAGHNGDPGEHPDGQDLREAGLRGSGESSGVHAVPVSD